MKMVPYQQSIAFLQKQSKTKDKCTMTVASFKRDRKIHLYKEGDVFTLETAGYEHDRFEALTEKEAFKLLKKKMKVEFPRSHKLYIEIHE